MSITNCDICDSRNNLTTKYSKKERKFNTLCNICLTSIQEAIAEHDNNREPNGIPYITEVL